MTTLIQSALGIAAAVLASKVVIGCLSMVVFTF